MPTVPPAQLVTVIIPTYNRSQELARLLHFLSGFEQHYRILTLDGGSEASREQNRTTCAAYQNVEHREFDPSLHLGVRIYEGLKLVQTPYVLLCGDDDFFFPEGVDECVAFLEQHPSHSAAIGKVWALRYFPGKPVVARGLSLGRDLGARTRFDQDRFVLRSLFYFAYTAIGSVPLYYALRRTDQTLKAFAQVTPDIKYSSMELLTNCLLLADGGVGILETPFGLRDYASVTTQDPEREGADMYIPLGDQAYIKPLLQEAITAAEGLDPAVAAYVIDSLLSLWGLNSAASYARVASVPRWRAYLSRYGIYLQCVLTRFLPGGMARSFGLDEAIVRSVLKSHQLFTSRPRKG